MKDTNVAQKDLAHIRKMMEGKSKFLSLSGLSGVMAGLYAIGGGVLAKERIENHIEAPDQYPEALVGKEILFIAFGVLVLSLITGFLFSQAKAKKIGEKVWNKQSLMLLQGLSIPLFTGAVVIAACVYYHFIGLVVPMSLIFYGLALIQVHKMLNFEIFLLGISQLLLGFISLFNVGYGLVFWMIGFGVFHILYGGIMYFRYDRK